VRRLSDWYGSKKRRAKLYSPRNAGAEAVGVPGPSTRLELDWHLYYAPIPAIIIDADGYISDFNLAFATLLDGALEPCRGEPVRAVADRLDKHVASGFLPTRQDDGQGLESQDAMTQVSSGFCRYRCGLYGRVELLRSDVVHIEPETGRIGSRVLYWEFIQIEDGDLFREHLRQACAHQLIWESYACSYDRVLPLLPYYQEAVARHVAAMIHPDVRRVLDVGAGTGNVSLELCKAEREVTAIDLSRAMLEQLVRKVPEGARSRVTVSEQNAENLRLWDDAQFDGVTILLALYDMAHPTRALQEAVRLLRPRGWIVVTEPRRSFRLEPLVAYVKNFLQERGCYEALRGDFERICTANISLNPAQRGKRLWAEDIEEFMRGAGFRELQVNDSHLGYCASICARKPEVVSHTDPATAEEVEAQKR